MRLASPLKPARQSACHSRSEVVLTSDKTRFLFISKQCHAHRGRLRLSWPCLVDPPARYSHRAAQDRQRCAARPPSSSAIARERHESVVFASSTKPLPPLWPRRIRGSANPAT